MENILGLKESNCRNCYKCIRNCPVKSIRFSDGQAQIVESECILCGRCFTVCPQNAKEIRSDVGVAKALIASGAPVYCSVAPSFVAACGLESFAAIEKVLLALGFAGAGETAEGASMVKKEYEQMMKKRSVLISSCCPTVNFLIEKYYPAALPYLAPVLTPMQAHCRAIKEEVPGAKTVFIGPCISKKKEAEEEGSFTDCVLTFEELLDWMEEENLSFDLAARDEKAGGRARFFPGTGGIIKSMDLEPEGVDYIAADGVEECMQILSEIEEGRLKGCFVELSACRGGCIAGPASPRRSQRLRSQMVLERFARSEQDFPIPQPTSEQLKKSFTYVGTGKERPGSAAIEEVLRKMGKNGPEDELNCGCCGYNTCREKAAAVLQGKADLSMCLPFLKEKAESFSDTILNNTPNGIFVLNETLEIQQINNAALQLFNLKRADDALDMPVVRILDPTDYMTVLVTGKNCYDKRVHLAEYEKYVEQTIVHDKDYHILICILRDVTAEEKASIKQNELGRQTMEVTDKVIEKQMRVVQEIASLLGETTAETKIALTKLKETLR